MNSVIDLGWHQTEEGQGALAHLRDPITGAPKRIFGILEKPSIPPSFNQVKYKLGIIGKSGVGKTALVCLLSNQREFATSSQIPPGETPGVRVTTVYWPAKINKSQIYLFQLELWDSGETATRKYNHILPVVRQNTSVFVYVFSFTDKSSYDDIESQLVRRSNTPGCAIVIGTKYGLQSDVQVTQADVARLETKFKVSVLRLLYHQSGQQKSGNPNEAAFALNFICDQLYAYSQDNPKDDQQKSKS